MNDLDKNTGEGTKVPNAPCIPIKWRIITSGEMRLSHPLTKSPFLPYISGGRIYPGDSIPLLMIFASKFTYSDIRSVLSKLHLSPRLSTNYTPPHTPIIAS